jgi:CRISPR-associated endonuclease/helicase Cas3
MVEFKEFWQRITGNLPFPYQERFATAVELPHQLNVITGAGKTATVVIGWLWRRKQYPDTTPRRLVYCLPMRTLVEQTYRETEKWLEKAGLIKSVELHQLMGGAVSKGWEVSPNPEKDCILIGTQDQLLSRALNRGYGMSRYRWSIDFALLNNDCLWVMDEVQLMGSGLQTTAQLQGFREKFGTYGNSASLWMSATLDSELLKTVDFQPDLGKVHGLTEADRVNSILKQRWEAKKQLIRANTVIQGKDVEDALALATEIVKIHIPGTLTIVICNRVNRAQALFTQLKKIGQDELLLLHSRYRAEERKKLNEKIYNFSSGIIVSTQAIEAGVDISARTMITELAPWSSLVQRFGRCNRYGECGNENNARIYWVDIDLNQKNVARPYESEVLAEARSLLVNLTDVGAISLQAVKAKTPKMRGLIPRKHDLLQLFDTSTDLAGHDIDISPFIRETDDTDIAIAWRDWQGDKPKGEFVKALHQKELCRVSLWQAQDFLKKLEKTKHAWVWDGLQGDWEKVTRLYPGITILLHISDGGYSSELGFTGDTKDRPDVVEVEAIEPEKDDSDLLTYQVGKYIGLVKHSQDVESEVEELCSKLVNYNLPVNILTRSGRWHDLGKAHPVFRKMLTQNQPEEITRELWAKSHGKNRAKSERPGFRHELVSALVALEQGENFLLTYLVAAHHGKIRMSIQANPNEKKPPQDENDKDKDKRYAKGVWDGDELKLPGATWHFYKTNDGSQVGDEIEFSQILSLACMEMGEKGHGKSWTAQAIDLLEEYGPFKLAFLETIIRLADWRASAKYNEHILSETDA